MNLLHELIYIFIAPSISLGIITVGAVVMSRFKGYEDSNGEMNWMGYVSEFMIITGMLVMIALVITIVYVILYDVSTIMYSSL